MRTSKNSRPQYKSAGRSSLQNQLLETRLRIEQAKLKKLESELPKETPQYTRYEDLPPPSPEDEKRFYEEFKRLFNNIVEARETPEEPDVTNQEIFAAAENELMVLENNFSQEPRHETDSPHAHERDITRGLRPF